MTPSQINVKLRSLRLNISQNRRNYLNCLPSVKSTLESNIILRSKSLSWCSFRRRFTCSFIKLWDNRFAVSTEHCLHVQVKFPCKSTSREDAGLTDVEMDPFSQVDAVKPITGHGMTVVGWYHSHPRFQPDPSITDIQNQSNYQRLYQSEFFESQSSHICPFVGLIIGTYDGKQKLSLFSFT